MKIGLWSDLDSIDGAYNLPLMKISAWHKARGDIVERVLPMSQYDKVYLSKIFSKEWTSDIDFYPQAKDIIKGGTGYGIENKLPHEIEHTYPDYDLYGIKNHAIGFLTRGCPNACGFCLVSQKEGRKSLKVADLSEFWRGQKNITLLDPNFLACNDRVELTAQLAATKAKVRFEQGLDARFINEETIELIKTINIKEFYFAWDLVEYSEQKKRGLLLIKKHYPNWDSRKFKVYVLTNYNTDWKFDIERVEWLKANGFDPYVMVYEKWKCDKRYKHLQRAVNNKIIFRAISGLNEYQPLASYL